MTPWTWIQEHQTLLVGIIGFIGVISTLLINAGQAREQRREERRHECQTLRAALIEELKINRKSMVFNMNGLNEISETQGTFVPTDLMNDVYGAFTDRIGLLSQAEVRKVMFAYLSLRQFNANLFLVGVPPDTGDRHVNVPPESIPMLSGMIEDQISPIDEAIEVMERARDASSTMKRCLIFWRCKGTLQSE